VKCLFRIKLTEYRIKVQAKEEKISELKLEIEALKTENSSLNACIVTQRNKIRELESELSGFEGVACKSSMTITSLQQDNKNLQKTVLELESRIK
jgi:multidrug resistance efflux pump